MNVVGNASMRNSLRRLFPWCEECMHIVVLDFVFIHKCLIARQVTVEDGSSIVRLSRAARARASLEDVIVIVVVDHNDSALSIGVEIQARRPFRRRGLAGNDRRTLTCQSARTPDTQVRCGSTRARAVSRPNSWGRY